MTFPTIDSAVEYLQSKIQDFYGQRNVIKAQLKKIYDLQQLAHSTGDDAAYGQLTTQLAQATQLLNDQLNLEDQLKPWADYFGFTTTPATLGILPIVLAGAAVGVAAMLYLHYEKIQQQQQALDMVAKGMLSADQAQAIVNPGILTTLIGSGSMSLMLPLLGLGVLYFWLTSRRSV